MGQVLMMRSSCIPQCCPTASSHQPDKVCIRHNREEDCSKKDTPSQVVILALTSSQTGERVPCNVSDS